MSSSAKHHDINKVTAGMLLVALGVIYGDIGTSPLYVMKAILEGNHGHYTRDFILGAVSLVFWTLTLQTTFKYVVITLRADNHGEGGIFSLYTLVRKRAKWLIIPAMVGGAALLADGMITPAVTVTSAIEGLRNIPIFASMDQSVVIAIVIAIITALFMIQRFGTESVGKLFGPMMLIWFSMLAVFGVMYIVQDMSVLEALNPKYAFHVLVDGKHNTQGIFILGGVFLATTGAEALYSDLGHAGRKNIYITWVFVKISLVLNYLGQAAWLLQNEQALSGQHGITPFFQMMPVSFLPIGVGVATFAAIIASQALISGSYTLISEAIKLNLFPRLQVLYPTNLKGQMYIPTINTVLMFGCAGLVLFFRESSKMEAAYGLSITVTMLMTTMLLSSYLIMKKVPKVVVLLITILFGSIETIFFAANVAKFFHGGYVTVLIALAIIFVMYIWIHGFYIKMRLREYVHIADYKNQLDELMHDTDRDKYATNLVYLTNCKYRGMVERKVMFSILDKRPKRADVYWFINVNVTDDPYTMEYMVDTIESNHIVQLRLNLGFRVNQKLNVYLRQIVDDLLASGEINIQARHYTTMPNRKVGDFRFILVDEVLSNENQLPGWENFVMRTKLFIKKYTVEPAKWFGIEASAVEVENVPLFLNVAPEKKLIRVK
ncbi:MAG: KUP/HAK/KT family potassium transporter [Culicoidibacterales bacterium]